MKDNIKNIFDNAIEDGGDTNIEAEKIQNTVMKRLGKQAMDNLKVSETEETVKPVFVTAPKRNGRRTAFKIAAGVTAACLGITAVSLGAADILNKNRVSALSEGTSESEESVNSDTTQQLIRNSEFRVLDGTKINLDFGLNDISVHFNNTDAFNIIEERAGRLYLLDSVMTINDKEEDKDITDSIGRDTPFTRCFLNEDESVVEHILAVGGDISGNDYGYAIMSNLFNGDWTLVGKFSGEVPQLPDDDFDSGKPQWLMNAVKLAEKEHSAVFNKITHETIANVGDEFKAQEENVPQEENTQQEENIPIVNCVPDMSNYSYSHHILENPDVEFCLLDGTLVQYSEEQNVVSQTGSSNKNFLISYKDGRLYYTGNGENRDITDIISYDNYFWTTYINSVTGLTHYVIVGGSVKDKEFEYVDLFRLREGNDNWETSTCCFFEADKYAENAAVGEDDFIHQSKWRDSLQQRIYDFLYEKYSADGFANMGGGATFVDLSE